MKIDMPLRDRIAPSQVGDLMPLESYTLSYSRFGDIPMHPRTKMPIPTPLADTYKFRGADIGLEDRCDVLVRANDPRDYRPDGFGYQPGVAYKILSEKTRTRWVNRVGLRGYVPCTVYNVERLPEDKQLEIFRAMKRDLEAVKREHFGSNP